MQKDTKPQRSKENTIEDFAWQSFIEADTTPFEVTKYNQLRPAYDAPSRTAEIARDVIDQAEHLKDVPNRERYHLAEHSTPGQLRAFARDVNASTMQDTLPADAHTDDIVSAIVQYGSREAK